MRVAFAIAALVAVVSSLAWSRTAAAAFAVPPLVDGHVVDTAGKLSRDDIDALNRQLEATRLQSGYVIDALVAGSLEGASIDDVAYQTFQTWKPGDAKRDNGVLIVVAPNERQDRIEVGKGIEGALTDLQTDDIRRQLIEPHLKEGDVRGGIAAGADAIAKVLVAADAGQGAPHQGVRIGARGIFFGGVFL
ncbi:MAG TPA: TPM domain-containing protein, partial [Polyangiaceae bacterium]